MSSIKLIFILLFIQSISYSQNLVPNPSFEELEFNNDKAYNNDKKFDIIDLAYWKYYWGPNIDIYHREAMKYSDEYYKFINCKNCPPGYCPFCIPYNISGYQETKTGDAYLGLLITNGKNRYSYMSFACAELIKPLIKSQKYYVEYFVSLSDRNKYCTDGLCAVFSEKPMGRKMNFDIIVSKVCNQPLNFISNKDEWIKISGTFIAKGDERYISIGNFTPINETNFSKATRKNKKAKVVSLNKTVNIRYFLDDIKLVPIDSLGNEIILYPELINGADTISKKIENIDFEKIEQGESIVLQNILFEQDKAEVLPSSYSELNELVSYLKKNELVEIEISGHTDNTGTDQYNLQLSESRAKAVADYIIKKGIEVARISYKGYGNTKPIASNETEQGKSKNRRVEFKILKK